MHKLSVRLTILSLLFGVTLSALHVAPSLEGSLVLAKLAEEMSLSLIAHYLWNLICWLVSLPEQKAYLCHPALDNAVVRKDLLEGCPFRRVCWGWL